MCEWNLHRGGEVEAMRTRWYGSGSEEELVERAGRRRVHTIGISPAVCGNDTNNRRHIIRVVITGKESVARDTSHRERGRGRGDRKWSGDGSGIGGRLSERLEGAENVGIKRERGEKGDIIATTTSIFSTVSNCSMNLSFSVLFGFSLVPWPHIFHVAILKDLRVSCMGGSLGPASAPSGSFPPALLGAEVCPMFRRGGGSWLEPAALCDKAAGWGVSLYWLFETLAAATPAREVPAVPPPSPSAPRP